ncbi:hypothetical protein GCM10011581_03970 [Saccharopolyspora subtropica]|uniref:Smu12A n=1 Tax=Saccharopolyspora thermophila TaxID=89367 RepID=A0A917N6C5_9PSEU|nr:hypothetical protein [Saccharopolyspora subtropica]GGI70112.1 hypothetical protein GCM10011581_03970 [Saccharopolyspora subtropica]
MHPRFRRTARGRGGPPWAGGGRGRRPEPPAADDALAWFTGRLPEGWFTSAPTVTVDREEIVVVGELPPVEGDFADDAERAAAESGRIARFREETREQRIEIARQAEHRYGRKVAWGARLGDTEELFTTLSVPVMTRLHQPERRVLDTLVDAGIARSRSEALAWAVRLVGHHTEEWLGQLREALAKVDDLRNRGPEGL